MAIAKANKEYNTFIKGLITEANVLAFPENASVDEDNFVLDIDGSRRRRLGIDYENNYALVDTGELDSYINSAFYSVHRWDNADNDPENSIGVVHIRDKLFFVDLNAEAFSSVVLNGGAAISITATDNIIDTAIINGLLVCVNSDNGPFYLSYDTVTDTVTKTNITIKIRDFWGVDDGIAVSDRPSTLSALHQYNLLNQGWTATQYDAVKSGLGTYPSNADIVHVAKDSNDDFQSGLLAKQFFGNTHAPSGKFIIDYRARGASRGAESGVSGLPSDSEGGSVSCVASYASRVFYSGIDSVVTGGDDESPNYSGVVFFSNIINNDTNLGACHQEADPTSEHISDIIDTDGGHLIIPEATGIRKLIPVGNSLLIVAENGLWELYGGTGGFSATDYQINKITTIGVSSPSSVVNAEGSVFFWSLGGIYLVAFENVSGRLQAQNVSTETIQSFYNNIPTLGKKYATGVYDPIVKKIRWLYNDSDGYGSTGARAKYNRELIFDTRLKAFYPHTISSLSGDTPFVSGYITSPGFTTIDTDEQVLASGDTVVVGANNVIVTSSLNNSDQSVVKYLTIRPRTRLTTRFTFSNYRNTDFMDWFSDNAIGVSFSSYLVTGYESLQDTQRDKMVDNITFHFNRTEDGFKLVDGVIQLANQSGCKVRSRWEWTNSAAGGRWGSEFQAYRIKLNYIPESVSDTFNYGYTVITTKNRLRGKGRALSLYITSEVGKDMHLLGWAVSYSGFTNV